MPIDDFTAEDFRYVIYDLPLYFEEVVDGNELVFESGMTKGVKLRIYTSVAADSEEVRPDSWDAIRVHFRAPSNMPNRKHETVALSDGRYRHIKRTPGWEDRVTERVESYNSLYPSIVRWCPDCDLPLAIRSGKNGLFAGCTGFNPRNDESCSYSESL